MAWGYGLKAENHKNGGLYITDIDDNEYLCVRGVDSVSYTHLIMARHTWYIMMLLLREKNVTQDTVS